MARVAAIRGVLVFALFAVGCSAPIVRNVPMLSPEDPHFAIEHLYPVRSPQFRRAIGHLLGPQIKAGNRVETLLNGDEIFPAMLEAIASARESITFETFIYWKGDIGERFTRALSERARAGVAVHLIIDWAGSGRIDGRFLDEMKHAGVQIRLYHEVPWYNPLRWRDIAEVENRTHRKILVVDGKVGFTGGVGIADIWQGNAESPEHWRDTHFRITGPVVAQLQSAFIDNWLESGGQVLHGDRYFPPLRRSGGHRAQAFKGSPREATENIELMYRLAIAAAERSIELSSAYFVPNPGTIEALIEAAGRGVKVQIIVPGEHLDSQLVKAASPALWGELLKAGIEIHRYQPTMYHCKVLVIDDYFSSLGSTNFDNRSFQLNDEVNLNVFDARFSAEQSRVFERDLERSKRVTYEEWKSRPWYVKAVNWAIRPFRREL
jgi:cardiolipin synthase